MDLNDLSIHRGVLKEATDIYIERERTRGSLWKDFDIEDAMVHIYSKAGRIRKAVELGHSAEDEALDLINYAVFYIRHIRGLK